MTIYSTYLVLPWFLQPQSGGIFFFFFTMFFHCKVSNNAQGSLEVVAIFKLNSLNNLQLLLLLLPTPSLVITPLLGIPSGRIQPYPCQAQELPLLASARPNEWYLCWQPFQWVPMKVLCILFPQGEKKKTALSPNLDAGSF